MRIPLPTTLKTRTGAPADKDARQKNSYVETRGEEAIVRKRPSAQGGIATGTGVAQGGIGLNINGVPYFIGFWADTMQPYTGGGDWTTGANYAAGGSGPDTQAWTLGTMDVAPQRVNHTFAYNGSIYVYLAEDVGTGNTYSITSSDGLNWTSHSVTTWTTTLTNNNIVYGNGIFLCAGEISGSIGETATSTDGINWTFHTNTLTSSFYDFEWNGSLFCGITNDGSIYTSTNGYTWTLRSTIGSSACSIAYNGVAFSITSNSALSKYSSDGITWNSATLPSSKFWLWVKANGSIFCAVDNTGYYAVSSDNGATWTQGLTGLASGGGLSSGNGIFLVLTAYNTSSHYATSIDGITWIDRTLPTSSSWRASIYGNKFVVMNNSTQCAVSTNGY
jgi:hypothetical protein